MSRFGSETGVWHLLSVNCIPTFPPRRKGILSLCTSVSWEHCPNLYCKPLPRIVMQLNYLCVPSSFFNKLQHDLGNLTTAQFFPWYVINIFHSYWVCLLSKSCCMLAYFLLKSLTTVHSVISTSSLIKINTNPFMCYSTWNNQNLACQLKSPWWWGPVIFSPLCGIIECLNTSLTLQKGQCYLIITISTSLHLKSWFQFPYNLGLYDCFNKWISNAKCYMTIILVTKVISICMVMNSSLLRHAKIIRRD